MAIPTLKQDSLAGGGFGIFLCGSVTKTNDDLREELQYYF